LGRAALYGAAAGLAGCILYAAVGILLNLQIGIIAVVVGVMVGKAVRAGSKGLGGRPQQILAVVLTYFSITTSYIPLFFYHASKDPQYFQKAKERAAARKAASSTTSTSDTVAAPAKPKFGIVGALLILLLLFAAAPLLSLTSGVSGIITLFILFIGLKQAWRLTGRSEILVMGPYDTEPLPAQ
jgi:hypothetical protein